MLDKYAQTVMGRCDALGAISEQDGRLTRRFATPALAQASETVAEWARAAGMHVRRDAVGNLVARYEAAQPGARTLLLGSHLDSVRDAGKYDGPLGVLVALACVERLHAQGRRLPFAIELLGFADEEGVRYGTAYLGSAAFAGRFDPALLERVDDDGVAMAEAIRAAGGDPGAIAGAARQPGDLIGYCEVHIEQGPVLEARNLPVGVVAAIAGQSRFNLRFTGAAGHAGTVPIDMRRDALCGAAELVLAAEAAARAEPGLVATVGQISVAPGASNVIPGQVALSLDLRHQDDAVLARAITGLRARAKAIAETRQLALSWQLVQEHAATPCDPGLTELLGRAVAAQGIFPPLALPSGAGHDAVVIGAIAPTAMLFVRCKGGISHNPAESVEPADVAVAIATLGQFVELLAEQG